MSLRPSRETIESLRLTLESLEQSTDPAADAQEVAELKRILLSRIADLEMLDALNAKGSGSNTLDVPAGATVADLPPVELVAADEPRQEATPQPESLDQAADSRTSTRIS